MKVGSKEFHELREQFEKDLDSIPVYVGAHPVRSKDGISGFFYENGKINDLFLGYMAGYANAKCLARMDALELNS